MIIDFHTHIFPPQIREHRERYFTGEPEFELLYEPPKAKLAGAEDIVGEMDSQGVDRSVIFGFPWRDPSMCRGHNDYILEAVSRFPDRLIGFACVNTADSGAAQEVERCIAAGLKGVGELAFYGSGIDAEARRQLAPIMAVARHNDLPVLIHTNEPIGHQYPGKSPNTLSQIYKLVCDFGDNRIVLAHWGGGLLFYHLLKKELKACLRNVWFDTAASPFLYDPQIYPTAAGIVGCDKILLGTDYPLLKPQRYFNELHKAGLAETDIELICGKNARKLLKI